MDLHEVYTAFVDRLIIEKPSDTLLWTLYAISTPIGLLALNTAAWSKVRFLVTLIHEFGHAFVGLTVGAGLQGIRIHHDSSGEATTYRRKGLLGWLTSKITTYVGYPAPGVFALLMILAVTFGLSSAVFLASTFMFLFFLLFMRNLRGLGLALLGSSFSMASFWFLPPIAQACILIPVSLFLIAGGAKSVYELWKHHQIGDTENSDVQALTLGVEPFKSLVFISYFFIYAASFVLAVLLVVRLTQ